MDNNLTISTLTFNLVSGPDAVAGSVRKEVSRGVNLPEIMSVKSQETTNSKTKVKETRTTLRFDRHLELNSGTIGSVAAQLTVIAPKDVNVTTADVLAVVERIVHTIQEDDSGLNKAEAIFVNGEQ